MVSVFLKRVRTYYRADITHKTLNKTSIYKSHPNVILAFKFYLPTIIYSCNCSWKRLWAEVSTYL